jgi:hypothetical protein
MFGVAFRLPNVAWYVTSAVLFDEFKSEPENDTVVSNLS